jgi:hypothetical protein
MDTSLDHRQQNPLISSQELMYSKCFLIANYGLNKKKSSCHCYRETVVRCQSAVSPLSVRCHSAVIVNGGSRFIVSIIMFQLKGNEDPSASHY